VEAWIEARLALGGHADVVAELPAQVAAQPLRERLQGLWMLALYRCGRRADALAVYREVRAQLVVDLGLDPTPPLQRLHRQILTGDPALDPPTGHAVVVPRLLPADPAAFTGREDELARLHRLVRPGRGPAAPVIAAIDGVAGVGKSALAVHAAHRLAARFPDGCLYADLRGATTDGPGAGGVWTDERSEEGRRRPEGAGARASEGERQQPGPGAGPGLGPAAAPLAVLCAFLRALGAPDRDLGSLDEAPPGSAR
jgi:hypothetical protein